VLYVLRPEELRRLLLPLGEKRKDEVRTIARELKLPAAKRPRARRSALSGIRIIALLCMRLYPKKEESHYRP